jgi:hypothetical protein
MANVTVRYPVNTTAPGGGGCFAWGVVDHTYFTGMLSSCSWTITYNGTTIGQGNGGVNHPLPCDWFAMIEVNNPPSGTVTLTVTIADNAGHQASGSSSFNFGAWSKEGSISEGYR